MHCHCPARKIQCFALFIAFAVFLLSGSVQGDGCHEPSKEIGDEAGLTADICSLTKALKRSPPDYVTAEAYYRLGYESRDIKLEEIAKGLANVTSGEYVDGSMELFEDEAWMHDMLQNAFEGTGIFEDMDDLRRATFIEKLLQGGALSHRLFSNLDEAYARADAGRRNKAIESMERAMANFFGKDSECSIFGTGQLRGIEFGVIKGGAAFTNYDIVESFADGIKAIDSDPVDLESLQAAIDLIRKNVITIYLHAITKYSTKIAEENDSFEAQAEGYGYYLAIAAAINNMLPEAHEVINDALSLENDPDAEKAAKVKGAVDDILEELGVNEDDFGTYDPDARDNYKEPAEVACEAVNPFQESFVQLIDFDR